jgi:4-hydroxysphinganine ceramide fatty acyl 2-hydroxylase
MFITFLRHGSVAALLVGAAIEAVAFLPGWIAFSPVLVLLGALMFYLSEYGMHRFAFHAPPLSWPVARKLQHRLHYDHHVEPNRLDLLFLPIWFLVPNLAVATGLFALIFGAEASLSALFGMMLAILHYEWVHYVAHIPYQPRSRQGLECPSVIHRQSRSFERRW